MINFFKNEPLTQNTSDETNLLLALTKNPLMLFPNYDEKFNESLEKVVNIKKYYQTSLTKLNQMKDASVKYQYKWHVFNDDETGIAFSTFLLFTGCALSLYGHSDSNYSYLFFLLLIIPYLMILLIKKSYSREKIKELKIKIAEEEKNIHHIKAEYEKTVNHYLKDVENFNVRKNLDYHYVCNIPELNYVIQQLLDKHIANDLIITENIEDNIINFELDILKYKDKISQYIKNTIDEKMQVSIKNKLLTMTKQ